MPTKRHLKKTIRQKRLIQTVSAARDGGRLVRRNSSGIKEDAIVRQFHQIQKGYARLMTDVAKELDLVKVWIGSQAMTKGNEIKARLNARLSRN